MAKVPKARRTIPVVLSFVTVLLLVCILPGTADTASAATQKVTFAMSDQNNDMTATFAVNANWDEDVSVQDGSPTSISYTLSSAQGTFELMIPLSYFGLEDKTVEIAIPGTPIGSVSIPISEAVSTALGFPLPTEIASIDLVLQASVRVSKIECSAGSDKIETPLSSLDWASWGTKSVAVDASVGDSSDIISVRTTLAYGLSYEVTASVFGTTYSLVPIETLSAVNGSPVLATSIHLGGGIPILLIVSIIAIVAVVLVVLTAVKRKKS